MRPAAIEMWHRIAKSGDAKLLDEALADDVVFQSPVVHTPQVGKKITKAYLASALVVLNNETFRYLNEWHGATSSVLEFQCVVNGIEINGIDIITWNEAGRIVNFKVMVRPLKAVNMLHQMMAAQLAGAKAPA
jgi:hypothetical protein